MFNTQKPIIIIPRHPDFRENMDKWKRMSVCFMVYLHIVLCHFFCVPVVGNWVGRFSIRTYTCAIFRHWEPSCLAWVEAVNFAPIFDGGTEFAVL